MPSWSCLQPQPDAQTWSWNWGRASLPTRLTQRDFSCRSQFLLIMLPFWAVACVLASKRCRLDWAVVAKGFAMSQLPWVVIFARLISREGRTSAQSVLGSICICGSFIAIGACWTLSACRCNPQAHHELTCHKSSCSPPQSIEKIDGAIQQHQAVLQATNQLLHAILARNQACKGMVSKLTQSSEVLHIIL